MNIFFKKTLNQSKALILFALLLIIPKDIYAKTSFIPLPAFSTNPNEGETYGMLPVWLVLDDDSKIKSLIAPSITYNGIYGLTGTVRFFGYPENGKKYEFISGFSTEKDQTIKFKYTDPKFLNKNVRLETEVKYINDISYRFYGIGPNTKAEDETNYTHEELKFITRLTFNIVENTSLYLQERYNGVRVKPGGVSKLPYAKDIFPNVPGMERTKTWAHKIGITFDSRDSDNQPTEGSFASIYTEFSERMLNTDSSFLKYGVHLKNLMPFFGNKKFTLVTRALFEKQDGHDVPFYERSMLGGDSTLRGYGKYRFFDNNSVLFSAEERIQIFKLNLFDVISVWEVAPFVEIGRVFNSYELPLFKEFKFVSGVGVRAIVRPNVIGRVDIGIGAEGVKIFVGLDYPF